VLVALASCVGPPPAPIKYGRENPRADIALRTAARDLGCPLEELRIEAVTNHRYVNETGFRYVVEGCGERAGYIESCELVGSPPPEGWATAEGDIACKDILMTRLRLGQGQQGPNAPPTSGDASIELRDGG
jgi:hypothetical protein